MRFFTKLVVIQILETAFQLLSAQSNTKPFSLTLTTSHPTVKAGASVWVTVQLINNSDQDIDESGSINGMTGADPNLVFDIRDEGGNMKKKRYI